MKYRYLAILLIFPVMYGCNVEDIQQAIENADTPAAEAEISSTTPDNLALDVPSDITGIEVVFAEPVDMTQLAITVQTDQDVPGQIEKPSTTRAVFVPDNRLESGKVHSVTVSGVSNMDGLEFNGGNPETFTFTVEQYDIPTVTSTTPSTSSGGIPGVDALTGEPIIDGVYASWADLNTSIIVNFNEPMDYTNLEFKFNDITGLYVAVGINQAYSSRDRVTWTPHNISITGVIESVASNKVDRLFAVGLWGQMAYSVDGINWVQNNSTLTSDPLFDIKGHQHNWVAVGSGSTILVSQDNGVSWLRDLVSGVSAFKVVDYDGTTWVAAGTGGNMYTTTNLSTPWVPVVSKVGGSEIVSLANDGAGNWVAGTVNGMIATSANASDWRHAATIFGGLPVEQVLYYNGKWVAMADGGKIAVSSDAGASWVEHLTGDAASPNAAAIASGDFLIMNDNGNVLDSVNGETWNQGSGLFNIYAMAHHPVTPLSGTVTTPTPTQAVFTPSVPLQNLSIYQAIISGVTDEDDGIPLNDSEDDFSFAFGTAPEVTALPNF